MERLLYNRLNEVVFSQRICILWLINISLSVCILSCSRYDNVPSDVQAIVEKYKNNYKELDKILQRYTQEKNELKKEAIIYLLRNLDEKYYLEGKALQSYQDFTRLIKQDASKGDSLWDLLNKKYGEYNSNTLTVVPDLSKLNAEQFFQDLDNILDIWAHRPWSKLYSKDFLFRYVLSCRIGTEIPEYNRQPYYNKYNYLIDSLAETGHNSVYDASLAVNRKIIDESWLFTQRLSQFPNFKASILVDSRVGNCRDMTDNAVYASRSLGIPVSTDLVLMWLHRPNGHLWNVLHLPNGRNIPFMGSEKNLGDPIKEGLRRGKVYRKVFEVNKKSLAFLEKDINLIPTILQNKNLVDVTPEYFNCYDINDSLLQETMNKYLFISIFNTNEWVPIDWTTIQGRKFNFKNLEGDIVFLPTFYEHGTVVPAADPIFLDPRGKSAILKANDNKPIKNMILTRVLPIDPERFMLGGTSGGTFEISNSLDFKVSTVIYTHQRYLHVFSNNIVTLNQQDQQLQFRYLRYKNPSGERSYNSLSEIEFWNSTDLLPYAVIKNDNILWYPNKSDSAFFDKNYSTFVTLVKPNAQIIFDFGKNVSLKKFVFSVGLIESEQTKVSNGHCYELLYWKNRRWEPFQSATAISNKIQFNNVPSNTIYILKDLTKNTKCQIFRYEHENQIW